MKTERDNIMTKRNDVPHLLRKRLGDNFEPEKIVGYQYSIGYIIEDWDLPIENYYCEKEEYWSDETHNKKEKKMD